MVVKVFGCQGVWSSWYVLSHIWFWAYVLSSLRVSTFLEAKMDFCQDLTVQNPDLKFTA